MSFLHRLTPGFAVLIALGLGYLYGLHQEKLAAPGKDFPADQTAVLQQLAAIRAILDAAPSRHMPSVAIPVATPPPSNPWITLVERTCPCPECPT